MFPPNVERDRAWDCQTIMCISWDRIISMSGSYPSKCMLFEDLFHMPGKSSITFWIGFWSHGIHWSLFYNSVFWEMWGWRVEHEEFTLVNFISICSQSCDLVLRRCVHLYLVLKELIMRHAAIDMYAEVVIMVKSWPGHLHQPLRKRCTGFLFVSLISIKWQRKG